MFETNLSTNAAASPVSNFVTIDLAAIESDRYDAITIDVTPAPRDMLSELVAMYDLDTVLDELNRMAAARDEARNLDADAELDALLAAGRETDCHTFDFTGEEAFDAYFIN